LLYRYGVILNYLFKVEKLREIGAAKLPYHLALKKVACIKDGEKFVPDEPNAYKLETLAVDIVKLMESCLGFEVIREREFAPVKNATGVDSVETARALLIKNGIEI
ncbi:MAG: UDPGP type 1 family protein, partial [Clostridia bacterium]|nr:UDPGP type 1 family protein [Clostridia bacterium]